MLNSIGIPLLGLAPPPGGGPASEAPTGAGGFAALLAAASAVEGGAPAGLHLASLLGGTPVIEGELAAEAQPSDTSPPLNLELSLVGEAFTSLIGRPDRSSEAEGAEGTEVADLEVDPAPSDLESPPLAALLGFVPPSIAEPVAVVVAATVDGDLVIEATPAAVVPTAAAEPEVTASSAEASGPPVETAPASPPTVRAQAPASPDRPETARAPEERVSTQVRAVDPQQRSEVAKAWNQAGGRFEGSGSEGRDPASPEQPSMPARAAVPATPAQPQDGTPAVPSSGNTPIGSAPDLEDAGGRAERSPTVRLGEGQPRRDRVAERDPVAFDPPASAATSTVAGQRAVEVPAGPPPSTPPLEARNAAALSRGLVDSVQAAVRNGDEAIRLVLNPPDLGQLEIRVTTGVEGVRVEVAAATSEAADLIRQQLPALVSGLEARELRVDRAEVRQALGAELGSREPRSGSRQPGDRGGNGQEQWSRPEWSGVAALDRASTRATTRRSEQATSRLLDLVA